MFRLLRCVFSLFKLNPSVCHQMGLFAWHKGNYKTLFSNETSDHGLVWVLLFNWCSEAAWGEFGVS